jgi:hypothetical protein
MKVRVVPLTSIVSPWACANQPVSTRARVVGHSRQSFAIQFLVVLTL